MSSQVDDFPASDAAESYSDMDVPFVLSELLIHNDESLASILAGIRAELQALNAHLRSSQDAK
jgi:hypothetical protein